MGCTAHTPLRVVTRRLYDFGKVPAGGMRVLNIARRLSVDGFQEVNFIIRGHAGSIGAGATILIQPLMDAWSLEDPSAFFITPIDARTGFPLNVPLSSTSTFPFLASFKMPSTGPYLSMRIFGSQPAIGQTTCNITLSVDLVTKGGTRPLEPTDGRFKGYRW
jgi:hypothetical protein